MTMALRRASQYGDNILDYIPEGITLLPNTSGSKKMCIRDSLRVLAAGMAAMIRMIVSATAQRSRFFRSPEKVSPAARTVQVSSSPAKGVRKGTSFSVNGPSVRTVAIDRKVMPIPRDTHMFSLSPAISSMTRIVGRLKSAMLPRYRISSGKKSSESPNQREAQKVSPAASNVRSSRKQRIRITAFLKYSPSGRRGSASI